MRGRWLFLGAASVAIAAAACSDQNPSGPLAPAFAPGGGGNLGDTAHRDTTHRDTTGRDTTHRDTTHRDTTGRDTTHRDTTHRDTTHRDTTHRDTTGRDTTHRDTTHRDTTHRDTTGRDTTHRDTTGRDTTGHGDSTHTSGQWVVRGVVLSDENAGRANSPLIPGVKVVIWRRTGGSVTGRDSVPGTRVRVGEATSGSNGKFEFGPVTAGFYELDLTPPTGSNYQAMQAGVVAVDKLGPTVSIIYLHRVR